MRNKIDTLNEVATKMSQKTKKTSIKPIKINTVVKIDEFLKEPKKVIPNEPQKSIKRNRNTNSLHKTTRSSFITPSSKLKLSTDSFKFSIQNPKREPESTK